MVAPPSILSSSATPTQKSIYGQQSISHGPNISRPTLNNDGLQPGAANARALSSSNMSFATRGNSLAPTPAPGSFSTDLRSQLAPSRAGSRLDITMSNLEKLQEDVGEDPERMLSILRESLKREMKIKEGSENLLEALNSKKAKQIKDQRAKAEAELSSSNLRIKGLEMQIASAMSQKIPSTPTRSRMPGLFQGSGIKSPATISRSAAESDIEEPAESPTYALAELLQALETEGLTPEYYVGHANNLVNLFKRYPSLKHDLVWSIFGLRMQVILLSESKEVVATGYRMLRHSISDISSLQRIRSLHTDYLVILSLIKERKADVEREQALKFVRAFLEVKDGVQQISPAVIRTIAAVAEHSEDRLRAISIETLAEIMIRDPSLLIASGGLRPVVDALGEGTYDASEGLITAFLYLLDSPSTRKFLRSGYELEILFTPFTDSFPAGEKVLKQNAKAILTAMKSWPGLMTLSMYNFRAISSLISSLTLPFTALQDTVIDLLYNLLRIRPPSWSASFLAGRRLTTYGRVTNLKGTVVKPGFTAAFEDDSKDRNFIDHYTTLLLAILISCNLLPSLLRVIKDADNSTLKRRTTLLIGEILKLASTSLPLSWSGSLQLLPELFAAASHFGSDERSSATSTVYQIDSISRTLYRSNPSATTTAVKNKPTNKANSDSSARFEEPPKGVTGLALDEVTFRQMMLDTQVPTSSNYLKWNWDLILKIIEGPLLNGKRLDEAIKASKFIKRITSFYRPFKYNFAEARNSRPNQKYVRVGCALLHTLVQTSEGVRYLEDNKLLRQMAECLAQCDPSSGLTAPSPMFSPQRLSETMASGYFAMIGTLTADPRGMQMLDRWKMINMMYHIVDVKQRSDLIKLLLSNFDYTTHGHPRVLLSKALTGGTKDIRIYATNILSRFSSGSRISHSSSQSVGDSRWALQLLVTQLYDPEVEVCATAIRILEQACDKRSNLEYIVECRPALDHLGEIGAPLLLRFLSTSIGYHYLDGLDYISNEMDDWFLGRNDSYVGVVEAVLARAFTDFQDEPSVRLSHDDELWEHDQIDNDARVPPHFYKELARTAEGCRLLREKGHFQEFASTIIQHGMQVEDQEIILKVKGCLWAVGNVGSMDLGGPFLEESNVVEQIVNIAENHEIMSLRGTAFFVLGLISRSLHGLEILTEYGWDSNTTILGESLGLCIPQNLGKLFSYKPWRHQKVHETSVVDTKMAGIAMARDDEDATNRRILELITDLGNTVLTKRAINELMQIKRQKAAGFRQPRLFHKVMTLLECHHFRLPIRRFIVDLFDKSVMQQIVLDEESSSEEETSAKGDGDGEQTSDDEVSEMSDSDGSQAATERQRSVSAPSGPPPRFDMEAR